MDARGTSWDEIRTALEVARAGTVSGAAEVMGVHHATVIRHVDALEARWGVKLFQRHARGYTPTEAGRDLLEVAGAADDRFAQLAGRVRGGGEGVAGELTVTSLASLSPLLAPALVELQARHPGLLVRYLTGDRLFRLEYGEAHVAVRAGAAPAQPDNVVQPFLRLPLGLWASDAYLARHGAPEGGVTGGVTGDDLARHRFVGLDEPEGRAPFNRWAEALAPREALSFHVSDSGAYLDAVAAGAGLGFLPAVEARTRPGLREVVSPREGWVVPLWLVTHVDLHRSAKVQACLALLKERAKAWA